MLETSMQPRGAGALHSPENLTMAALPLSPPVQTRSAQLAREQQHLGSQILVALASQLAAAGWDVAFDGMRLRLE